MKKNLLVLAIAVLLIGCSKFEEPPSDTPIREQDQIGTRSPRQPLFSD